MTAYKLKNSHGKYVIIWHVFNLRSKCGTGTCAGVAWRLRRESHKARQEGDKLICLEGDETNKGKRCTGFPLYKLNVAETPCGVDR